jgi:hypothetical protein
VTASCRQLGRVDEKGRAFKGSQLQIQIYVNRRQSELEAAVLDALPSLRAKHPHLEWVSPLESEIFEEYRNGDFLRALGLDEHVSALADFWPRRGPCWDALAAVECACGKGVLLVEAKSYPEELLSRMKATSAASIAQIDAALGRTAAWLGLSRDWIGDRYQAANRLAHLYFLREVAQVPAWLVNVCFLDDPHRPTSEAAWLTELGAEKGRAGAADCPYVGSALLPARDRRELLARLEGSVV